jgi:hypothetical protein
MRVPILPLTSSAPLPIGTPTPTTDKLHISPASPKTQATHFSGPGTPRTGPTCASSGGPSQERRTSGPTSGSTTGPRTLRTLPLIAPGHRRIGFFQLCSAGSLARLGGL